MQVLMGKTTAFLAFLLTASMPAIAESIPQGLYPEHGRGWQVLQIYCVGGGLHCPHKFRPGIPRHENNYAETLWARYVAKRGKLHFVEGTYTTPSHLFAEDPFEYAVNCDTWEAKGMAWMDTEADKEWFTIRPGTVVDQMARFACK